MRLVKYIIHVILVLVYISCVLPSCLDIPLISDKRLECYGNCKHVIPGECSLLLCLRECLLFSFCTAVNYNQGFLKCELLHLHGSLQPEMLTNNSDWRALYATNIPDILAGVCGGHHCQSGEKCVELTSQNSVCVSHGLMLTPGMYGDLLPNTRLYHPGDDTNITMYECTALMDPQPKESFPVARIVDGIYTQASVSCSSVDCFDPSLSYEGSVTATVSGIHCQRWDTSVPHVPNYNHDRHDLKNFCRIPADDNEIRPWCYTTDPNVRWEYCPIIDC
ncbi:hepatocyte growth factor-like protein [Argopecten irradians]|uniref:hepatocyte growth factor-like protein n=1 Tax=Argopecten irradians TaxID=31199 RepID=UPI0037192DC6